MADTSITLPDVQVTAKAPAPPVVSTLQTPYAVRKIDLTFTLGTGDFGAKGADQLTVTGLRVYAQIQNVVSPHGGTVASLRVYGLTLDHINKLSYAGQLYRGRRNQIQIRAGDNSTGMTTVFDGIMQEAYPAFDGSADPTETAIQLGQLHVVAALIVGRNSPLTLVARQAARGEVEASAALAALNAALPTLLRWRVLAAYGACVFGVHGKQREGRAPGEDQGEVCPLCGRR